jgi:hypothetical protein
MSLTTLIPTLQFSIGPVILISGVGLLLLSITNRLGRVIDRSRLLTKDYHQASGEDRVRLVAQLRILTARAKLVRSSIIFASVSVLLTALMIISLFLGALLQLSIAGEIVILFVLCLLSLISSLIFFISDINLSLQALWHEIPLEGQEKP